MGFMDRFKKKEDDDLGDLSDLGDFGLDDKSSGGSGGLDDLGGGFGGTDLTGDLPSPDVAPKPGMHAGVPTHMEDVQPSPTSMQMGAQHGIDMNAPSEQEQQQASPAGYPPQRQAQQPQQQPSYAPQPQYQQQQPYGGREMYELTKDMEIIHAKLDAIKSSLDSINQRLATLERMAGADSQQQRRYSW